MDLASYMCMVDRYRGEGILPAVFRAVIRLGYGYDTGMVPPLLVFAHQRERRDQIGGELLHGPLQGGALVDYFFCF